MITTAAPATGRTTAHPTSPVLVADPLDRWSAVTISAPVRMLRRLVMLLWWRPLVRVVGPLRVVGTQNLPPRPCVLVCDHHSHADTIAIQVALSRVGGRRVVAAAAADHWFRSLRRRVVATFAVGAFPFPRDGDGGLRQAARLLELGHDVIIFPQGSRRVDAEQWRSGVGRLATELEATLVGVRVDGTARVLPPGASSLTPQPMSVGFGRPLNSLPGESARQVTQRARHASSAVRLPGPVEGRLVMLSSRLRDNATRRGLLILAVWAFAEATVWPLIPDLMLAGMVLAAPRLAHRFVAVTALSSAVGGVVALQLARAGWSWPLLAVTDRMAPQAAAVLADGGASGVLTQPLSGIPVKVFNVVAAGTDIGWWQWAGWSLVARGARMAVVAGVVWLVARLVWSGRLPQGWSPRIHALLVIAGSAAFVLGWGALLTVWR
ncbi:MAG: 1-acyl-sn-glycerol-3-phosphate acyltransferase [Euzebya sp.]